MVREDMDYQTKNEVQSIIEEIKDANVSVENYKKYIDKINNTDRIILAQLENFIRNYKDLNNKLKNRVDTPQFRDSVKESRLVPYEVYELQQDLLMVLRDSYSWKSMSAEISKIFFSKITDVLDDIGALDIKKGALEEMREMEKQRNKSHLEQTKKVADMTLEIVNHKLSIIDEKIINTFKFLNQEIIDERKKFIALITKILENKNKDEVFKEIKTSSINEIEKNMVLEKFKPIDKDVFKKIDDEEDEDDEDENPFAVSKKRKKLIEVDLEEDDSDDESDD